MSETKRKKDTYLSSIDRTLDEQRRWVFVLFISTFALKLLYVLQSSQSLHATVPIMDSEYYHRMAVDIQAGNVIRHEAFFMGPLYSYVLAAIYSIFGKSFLIVRIIQVLGGVVTVLLTYFVGRCVFRPSVAMLGAVFLGLYGTSTFYEGQLLMMWLGTLINVTILFVLYRTRGNNSIGKYALVGALLGLSVLARANILMFAPVVILWLFVSGESRRLVKSIVFVGALMVAILPATIHNGIASRDFVPITSNGGFNFYVGNSGQATGIFYPPRGINLVSDSSIKDYVERELAREMKPSEVSRYWFGKAFDFIGAHPLAEFKLMLKKTAMFFNGYEVPQIESYDRARERHGVLRLFFINFWILVSLGILGMVYCRKDWRKYFLLYGYIFAFSFSIILFFVSARYRVQIAPILSLFAAYAALVVTPRTLRRTGRTLVPLFVFGAILICTRPGIFALPKDDVEWREKTHQARRLSMMGRHAEAIEEIDRAIELKPDYADSYVHRAVIYRDQHNLFKTVESYSKALDLNNNLPSVHYDLAQVMRQLRMFEPAIESYKRAIRLNPKMIQAYNNLGITYRETKMYEAAVEAFKRVLEMNPRYIKAYNNLGVAYAEMGEADEAVAAFQKAIEIDPTYAISYKNLAMVYVQQQKVTEARDALVTYLLMNPTDSRASEILSQLREILQAPSRTQ